MTQDEYDALSAAWLRAQAERAQDEAMDAERADDDALTFGDMFALADVDDDAHFKDGDE